MTCAGCRSVWVIGKPSRPVYYFQPRTKEGTLGLHSGRGLRALPQTVVGMEKAGLT